MDRWVALRKESVDRNFHIGNSTAALPRSLSARRAWIEIFKSFHKKGQAKSLSARRAWIEIREQFKYVVQCRSLSARRAWIEIS